MLAPVAIAPDGDADIVAVRFEPFGAHALLGLNQSDAADQILDVDSIGERWLTRAVSQAEAAGSTEDAVNILERALLARLDRRAHRGTDARITAAVAALVRHGGVVSIGDVAKSVGTTPRHLERLFAAEIGTSPKRFARVLRFQAAAAKIADGDAPLADVSIDTGYFDQAHMIRDFLTFAGTTPGQFATKLGELTRAMLS